MKIRLTMNVPVAREHGMTTGRELEVLRMDKVHAGAVGVMSDAQEIRLWGREYEVIESSGGNDDTAEA